MLERHPGAGCRQRRATGNSFPGSSFERGPQPGLPCRQGDGLGGHTGTCMQRAGDRVKDEDDLLLAQLTDHVPGGLVPGVDSAAGAPPALPSGGPGEQQVKARKCGRMRSSRTYAFFRRCGPGADLHGQAQAQFQGGEVTAWVSDRPRRDRNRLERQRNVTTYSGHYDRGPDPPDLGCDRLPSPDRP